MENTKKVKKRKKMIYIFLILEALSDFGVSTGFLFSLSTENFTASSALCIPQAFTLEFFTLTSIFYSALLGFALFFEEIRPKSIGRYNVTRIFTILIFVMAGISTGVTLILFLVFPKIIGLRMVWCWITVDGGKNIVYEIAFLYGWVFLVYVLNIFFYLKILIKKYKAYRSCQCGCSIIWYLLVYIIVFTAPLLLRIFQFFDYENIFHVNDDIIAFLLHMYIVTIPMKGIFNFIITMIVFVSIEGIDTR